MGRVIHVGRRPHRTLERRRWGRSLAAARVACGLTVAQLAVEIGRDRRRVARWEAGQSAPSASDAGPLSAALGVSPEVLLRSLDDRRAGQVLAEHAARAAGRPQSLRGWLMADRGDGWMQATRLVELRLGPLGQPELRDRGRRVDVDALGAGWYLDISARPTRTQRELAARAHALGVPVRILGRRLGDL